MKDKITVKKTLYTLLLISYPLFFTPLCAQNIYTVAGNGTGSFCCDGGPAAAAELNNPFGVAIDVSGNLYIADYRNNRIRKVNTSGIITTIAGNGTAGYSGDGGQATAAELYFPASVATDASGNIYIADVGNERIRLVSTSGIISTFAGIGTVGYSGDGGQATAAELHSPYGVALDASGNIYIADELNQRIRMVNSTGIINTFAGNGTGSYSGDGGQATVAEIYNPSSITANAGNLYIADYTNARIRIVNSSGIINTFAGTGITGFSGDGGPATAAKLNYPAGTAIDASGNIYIADQTNERIRIINTSGIINTFAGRGVTGFSGDGGPATAAEFWVPECVATDASGNLYIADEVNNRIREVTTGSPLLINEINPTTVQVSVYPNPSNGKFTFRAEKESRWLSGGETVIEVYNMLGEKVSEDVIRNSQFVLDLSNKPSGVYLYRILTLSGKSVSSGKLIIEQ